ncbi:hypothetical protein [Paracoccus wurundjeri]|uniref:hypothetical protein n=1 Tax=Paracoccus onubensis TaxID=1675788 RepID=UPI00273045C6|nr:hypothetical protein [Paracoccus onubensis]
MSRLIGSVSCGLEEVVAFFVGEEVAHIADSLPEHIISPSRRLPDQRLNERLQAAAALRMLIEKIVLTPGPERGEMFATLHGDLATILE